MAKPEGITLPDLSTWRTVGDNGPDGQVRMYTDAATGRTYLTWENCVDGRKPAKADSPNVLVASSGGFQQVPGPFGTKVSVNVTRDKDMATPTIAK